MATFFSYDVFLSYNKQDKPQVRRLAERLRSAGVRVWFDDWIIKPGDDIFLSIERGLETSHTLVLCLSPAALDSDWVKLERSTVLFRDPTNEGRRFIPLLLADCDLPRTLRRYRYVDYRNESLMAFEELLSACGDAAQALLRSWSGDSASTDRAADKESELHFRVAESIANSIPFGVQLWKVLDAGDNEIYRISWSPSGSMIAAACRDKKVRIWDVETGALRSELIGHEGAVFAVSFAPNGKLMASAGRGGVIRLWEVGEGRLCRVLDGHSADVWGLSFSSDSKMLASASDDGAVGLWDMENLTLDRFLEGHLGEVWGVAFSGNGEVLASGGTDGKVIVWDVKHGTSIQRLKAHKLPVFTVVFSPDSSLIASCSVDAVVKIWDGRDYSLRETLKGHSGSVEAVAFSADGTLLATKSLDKTVKLWDCKQWRSVITLDIDIAERWHPGLAFHPTMAILATLDRCDTVVKLWRYDTDKL